jgi:hypothetical protein
VGQSGKKVRRPNFDGNIPGKALIRCPVCIGGALGNRSDFRKIDRAALRRAAGARPEGILKVARTPYQERPLTYSRDPEQDRLQWLAMAMLQYRLVYGMPWTILADELISKSGSKQNRSQRAKKLTKHLKPAESTGNSVVDFLRTLQILAKHLWAPCDEHAAEFYDRWCGIQRGRNDTDDPERPTKIDARRSTQSLESVREIAFKDTEPRGFAALLQYAKHYLDKEWRRKLADELLAEDP